MGQINTNNYPTVNSLLDADLLIVENATHGTGTTTPKQLRENAIGTDTLHTSAQSVTGAINELKGEIDAGAGVVCYDVNTITSGYLGGQFSGSANLLLLHLTTDGTADATNGYMMMLSYSRPVARFAIGRLVDADGVAYKQDVYADNTIICTISGNGEGTESDPVQVVILGIINAGFMLTPTAVVSDRDIIDGQGNTLSVLAEALTKTASGNPVVISDCAGGKARSLITEINAIQDLHGLPFPYVGGAYKNKLPMTVESIKAANTGGTWSGNAYTYRGIVYTLLTDSADNITGINVNGNNTGTTSSDLWIPVNQTIDGVLNGCPSGGSSSTYLQTVWSDQGGHVASDTGSGVSVAGIAITSMSIRVRSGVTISNKVFYPMIRLATESDATFAPYSNICPISGRDSVIVTRKGKNLWDNQYPSEETMLRYRHVFVGDGDFTMSTNAPLSSANTANIFFLAGKVEDGASTSLNGVTVNTPRTVTAVDGYVTVSYRTGGGITPSNYNSQIEQGSTPTPYEAPHIINVTIQLGQTVYGADINWDTGVMTVKTTKVDMSSLEYRYASDSGHERMLSTTALSNVEVVPSGSVAEVKCSMFKPDSYDNVYQHTSDGIIAITPQGLIGVYSTTMGTDATAFKAAVTGQDIEYELATPTTIQLTPTQLSLLKGYNRVTIDNGNIDLLAYIGKTWS